MFPGDEAWAVQEIQHRVFPTALEGFSAKIRRAGLYAEAILQAKDTEVGSFCRNTESFDHRVLQDMHDQIAAAFRFQHYRWPLFQVQIDEAAAEVAWTQFRRSEFDALMEDTTFAIGALDALRFSNKPQGYAGEAAMAAAQRRRYWQMHEHTLPRASPDDQTSAE